MIYFNHTFQESRQYSTYWYDTKGKKWEGTLPKSNQNEQISRLRSEILCSEHKINFCYPQRKMIWEGKYCKITTGIFILRCLFCYERNRKGYERGSINKILNPKDEKRQGLKMQYWNWIAKMWDFRKFVTDLDDLRCFAHTYNKNLTNSVQ